MKYVLVTGGVVSGLGKGVTASSIGVLLKGCGHRVTCIKIGEHSCFLQCGFVGIRFQLSCNADDADPYLNTDAGTMSPFEHGEVFVLDDGGEVRCACLDLHFCKHSQHSANQVFCSYCHAPAPGSFLNLGVGSAWTACPML